MENTTILKLLYKDPTSEKIEPDSKTSIEVVARPSDAIALAVRTKCSIWMFEQVVADASIPVNEEADVKDQNEFKQFLDKISPSDLIRHLKESEQINEKPFKRPDSDNKKQS